MKIRIIYLILCISILPSLLMAQKGAKERIKVHIKVLEGNLVNDPAERDATVYLPPSYSSKPESRYPVLYMLHGFTDDDSKWFGWEKHWINLKEVIDEAIGEGLSKEMIVVMPNAYNRFKGSMYSSSVTIGDWETFVSKELVEYIDANYRTLANAASRGLAGHSMGGYGTLRLGIKYPEVWSSIYTLSPCCIAGLMTPDEKFMSSMESITKIEDLEGASFMQMATLASAAAWAPNPNNPPFYLDLPFTDGEVRPEIAAKLTANRTLYSIDQYIPNIKKLKAIALDAGDKDRGISGTTKQLHEILDVYEIEHFYESYDGDHLNRIAERIKTKTLPFFSENLAFE